MLYAQSESSLSVVPIRLPGPSCDQERAQSDSSSAISDGGLLGLRCERSGTLVTSSPAVSTFVRLIEYGHGTQSCRRSLRPWIQRRVGVVPGSNQQIASPGTLRSKNVDTAAIRVKATCHCRDSARNAGPSPRLSDTRRYESPCGHAQAVSAVLAWWPTLGGRRLLFFSLRTHPTSTTTHHTYNNQRHPSDGCL